MRMLALASAASALAAATIVAGVGAGAAHAEGTEEGSVIDPDAKPCIWITTYTGVTRAACLYPAAQAGATSSFGYGSLGTGSLADLFTGLVNTGSVVLSVDLPNSTGSYAPGSTGSYGPEASVGQILSGSIGSLGGAV